MAPVNSRWVAALALCAACSEERVAIDLPAEAASAKTVIVAIHGAGEAAARMLVALAPADAESLASLPVIRDYEGEALEITALLYDRSLAEMELEAGELSSSAAAEARRLADVAPQTRRTFALSVGGDAERVWRPIDTLPAPIGEHRLPPSKRDRCAQVTVRPSRLPRQPLINVETIALPSNDRAIFGGTRTPTIAILGTVERSGDISWRDLDPATERLKFLVWDEKNTVFGWIKLVSPLVSRLVQLDLSGRIVLEAPLDITPDEVFRLAAGADRVIAYSELRALELSAGSTAIVDRSAEFPRGLLALTIVRSDRMAAVTSDGTIHYFDGTSWSVDDRPQPPEPILKIFGDETMMVALSYGDVFVRDEQSGRWPRLETPFPSSPKLWVKPLGNRDFMLGGAIGILAIYEETGARWCEINTGTLSYMQQIHFSPNGRHGISFDHDEPTIPENSIFQWLELPEGGL